MTTFQITLDEQESQALSQKARLAGMTPEAWLKELATTEAAPGGSKEWIEKFLESARKAPGNSGGWKWNREELYDR